MHLKKCNLATKHGSLRHSLTTSYDLFLGLFTLPSSVALTYSATLFQSIMANWYILKPSMGDKFQWHQSAARYGDEVFSSGRSILKEIVQTGKKRRHLPSSSIHASFKTVVHYMQTTRPNVYESGTIVSVNFLL